MKSELVRILAHPLSIGCAVFFFAIVVQWAIRRTIRKLEIGQFLTNNTARRLRTTARVVVVFLAGLIALQITGAMGEAWAILSATIAALAVGFVATWSVLSNITSALVLLGFRPFRIGDEIEILEADKILAGGTVLDLNLFYTTLGSNGAATRVPNNMLLQRVVRVMRSGVAPNPTEDAIEPFYSYANAPKTE